MIGPPGGIGPTGCLKITRCPYPSHSRLDLMQFLHTGFSSPHFMRRLRHAEIFSVNLFHSPCGTDRGNTHSGNQSSSSFCHPLLWQSGHSYRSVLVRLRLAPRPWVLNPDHSPPLQYKAASRTHRKQQQSRTVYGNGQARRQDNASVDVQRSGPSVVVVNTHSGHETTPRNGRRKSSSTARRRSLALD